MRNYLHFFSQFQSLAGFKKKISQLASYFFIVENNTESLVQSKQKLSVSIIGKGIYKYIYEIREHFQLNTLLI